MASFEVHYKKSLKIFGKTDYPWFCNSCLQMPMQAISNNCLIEELGYNSNTFHIPKGICSFCNKIIKIGDKTVKCKLSNHFIHSKCAGNIQKSNTSWICKTCYIFLFDNLKNEELEDLFTEVNLNSSQDGISSQFLNIPQISNCLDDIFSCDDNDEIDLCKYYSIDDFNELYKSKKISLSLLHTNIRSLQKNYNNLHSFLETLNCKFDFIALTETWKNKRKNLTSNELSLSNYSFEELGGSSQNSCCGLYIKKCFNYKVRLDLCKSYMSKDEEFQSLWIEILKGM